MIKKIVVQRVNPPTDGIHIIATEMTVVYSDHERFRVGSATDPSYLNIAGVEGYVIIIYPAECNIEDMNDWTSSIEEQVRALTDRIISLEKQNVNYI